MSRENSTSLSHKEPLRLVTSNSDDDRDRQARIERGHSYASTCESIYDGDESNEYTLGLCAVLTRRFNLTDDETVLALEEWNQRCYQPWDENELRKIVQRSREYIDPGDAAVFKTFDDSKIVKHCLPVLNQSFRLFRDLAGIDKVFYVNDRNECTLQQEQTPLKQVLHDELKRIFGVIPPERLLQTSITLWKKECKKLQGEPAPFTFAGDTRLCFKHFDWEPAESPFQAWEEFLSRLSDRESFMAFVWSCFEEENKSRQYVWLRGEGQDGKSKVLGVINRVFGSAATGIGNAHLKSPNQFLYSAIYGKRVVIYADCKNTHLGMTEFVRNCTSGDPVPVEFKGQTPFSWDMYVKLFVASNPKPSFTSQGADTSRVIYIEVAESKSKNDPNWSDQLEAELPGFLFACRKEYERLCPNHGDIQINDTSSNLINEAASAFEEDFYGVFEECFKHVKEAKTEAKHVRNLLKDRRFDNNKIGDMKQWMERTHGIKYRRTKEGRFYENLALAEQYTKGGR